MTSSSSQRDARVAARVLGTVSVLLFAVASCSSTLEPRSGVTLLVSNETCQAGHCDSLEVLAFPGEQPDTPGGYWSIDLGRITTPQACFTLPVTATFSVIGNRENGAVDTTTFTWNDAQALSLGTVPPAPTRLFANPSTNAFRPASAAGWRVTLPAETQVTSSSACAP